jgi:hypothetical protein
MAGFNGFEQGPIRPPSEAQSLLVRLTRNCPWNKCTFCPVYKGQRFSVREVDEIRADIDAMAAAATEIKAFSWRAGEGGEVTEAVAREVLAGALGPSVAPRAIALWLFSGGKNVFFQDANSLVMKPADVIAVLTYLREKFATIERVTTYARSATVARMKVEDLRTIREAGLTRVHIGLESGSDEVLTYMRKGTTADEHVRGGRNVIDAGLELSEYVMPGLGGRRWTTEHAIETARVLNAVNPHFIRLRSLHVHSVMPLCAEVEAGNFEPLSDDEVASEIRLLIERLSGIESRIVSDHILNLLEEVEGKLPEDKDKILAVIDGYLGLPESDRLLYILARRAGLARGIDDLGDPGVRIRGERIRERLGIANLVDANEKVRGLMDGYI